MFDACRVTSIAMHMVTLALCDYFSGSCNGWLIEWWKVNMSCGVTKARMIALAPEGRQRIVVFATVII